MRGSPGLLKIRELLLEWEWVRALALEWELDLTPGWVSALRL
jgi:hypothetical protein